MVENIINELVRLDEEARESVSKAENERDSKKTDIERETADLRAQYLARAQRRIESVRESTGKDCERQQAELAEAVEQARTKLDEGFAKNRERWITEIVSKCKQPDLTR